MKNVLLALHLAFVGLWLGCVLTEVLFERALLGTGRAQERLLARLHRRVDIAIEAPAFLLVLGTGTLLLAQPSVGGMLLWMKVAFGIAAVAANAYCMWLVMARAAAADKGDWHDFESLDRKQHRYGAVVLVALLIALGLGVYLLAR